MAIKDIIAPGIGFAPGSVEYIVTRGFVTGEVVIVPEGLIDYEFTVQINRTEAWSAGIQRTETLPSPLS